MSTKSAVIKTTCILLIVTVLLCLCHRSIGFIRFPSRVIASQKTIVEIVRRTNIYTFRQKATRIYGRPKKIASQNNEDDTKEPKLLKKKNIITDEIILENDNVKAAVNKSVSTKKQAKGDTDTIKGATGAGRKIKLTEIVPSSSVLDSIDNSVFEDATSTSQKDTTKPVRAKRKPNEVTGAQKGAIQKTPKKSKGGQDSSVVYTNLSPETAISSTTAKIRRSSPSTLTDQTKFNFEDENLELFKLGGIENLLPNLDEDFAKLEANLELDGLEDILDFGFEIGDMDDDIGDIFGNSTRDLSLGSSAMDDALRGIESGRYNMDDFLIPGEDMAELDLGTNIPV